MTTILNLLYFVGLLFAFSVFIRLITKIARVMNDDYIPPYREPKEVGYGPLMIFSYLATVVLSFLWFYGWFGDWSIFLGGMTAVALIVSNHFTKKYTEKPHDLLHS